MGMQRNGLPSNDLESCALILGASFSARIQDLLHIEFAHRDHASNENIASKPKT